MLSFSLIPEKCVSLVFSLFLFSFVLLDRFIWYFFRSGRLFLMSLFILLITAVPCKITCNGLNCESSFVYDLFNIQYYAQPIDEAKMSQLVVEG